MPTDADPIVESWYEDLDKDRKFEVIDVDEINGVVEIQFFDGTVDELDLNEWYELNVEPVEAPEDWTVTTDISERDDLGYTETGMKDEDWGEPKRAKPARTEEREEDERWEEEK